MSKIIIAALSAVIALGASQAAFADEVTFETWVNGHPEWVTTHQKEYHYWLKHPHEAELNRKDWYEWTAPSGNSITEFRTWSDAHPEWVKTHHDRYEWFVAHPERVNEFRKEWYEWRPEGTTTTTTTTTEFRSWADTHPEWVKEHHERYEYFVAHPEEANHYRQEWIEVH